MHEYNYYYMCQCRSWLGIEGCCLYRREGDTAANSNQNSKKSQPQTRILHYSADKKLDNTLFYNSTRFNELKSPKLSFQWWLTEGEAIGQSVESPLGSRWNMRKGLNGNRSSGPAAQKQQIIWLEQLWKSNCCTAVWWGAETAQRFKTAGEQKLLVPCSCSNMEGGEEGRSRRTETGQKNSSGLWQKGSGQSWRLEEGSRSAAAATEPPAMTAVQVTIM